MIILRATDKTPNLARIYSSYKRDQIVEFLLQHRTNIDANQVGWALQNAAKGRHTTIVELLLRFRTDILTHHVVRAISYASQAGHASIVNLILQ